jgi:hypothetical protein
MRIEERVDGSVDYGLLRQATVRPPSPWAPLKRLLQGAAVGMAAGVFALVVWLGVEAVAAALGVRMAVATILGVAGVIGGWYGMRR